LAKKEGVRKGSQENMILDSQEDTIECGILLPFLLSFLYPRPFLKSTNIFEYLF
jgi:hypothetical protein